MLHKGNQHTAYNLPERSVKPSKPFDACRVHGKLTLNKVAGNFHITGGKSIHFASGHIHINSFFDDAPLNFSHRINRFSFGDTTAGIVHPLEGDERIITDSTTMAQYFIEVVPTDIYSFLSHIKAFQYSVKENVRPISTLFADFGIFVRIFTDYFVHFHRSSQRFARCTRTVFQIRHVRIESHRETGSREFRSFFGSHQFSGGRHYRDFGLFEFNHSIAGGYRDGQKFTTE